MCKHIVNHLYLNKIKFKNKRILKCYPSNYYGPFIDYLLGKWPGLVYCLLEVKTTLQLYGVSVPLKAA